MSSSTGLSLIDAKDPHFRALVEEDVSTSSVARRRICLTGVERCDEIGGREIEKKAAEFIAGDVHEHFLAASAGSGKQYGSVRWHAEVNIGRA